MRQKSLPLARWVLVGALGGLAVAVAPAAAQVSPPGGAGPERFAPRYIDPAGYRSDEGALLRDWPALARLVVWSRGLEQAVADADETLSAELVTGFRARVDSLAGAPVPPFLGARADSVRAVLTRVQADLEKAEERLAPLPPAPAPEPTGGRASNEADRQRTLITGNTAVTVPAGVAVGQADTLPEAEPVEGAEGRETYVDLVARALVDLDGLVHLTRTVGRPAPAPIPEGPPPGSPPDTARARPAP